MDAYSKLVVPSKADASATSTAKPTSTQRLRRLARPIRALSRSSPKQDGRRCGGGKAALLGSPPRWCRNSCRPRVPPRSGAGWLLLSIRSSPQRSSGRARHGWQRLGLSAPKIRALKEIARAVAGGKLAARDAQPISRRRSACGAYRGARHRSVDRRHLFVGLPRPCRCLAGRRPCLAGGGPACFRLARAADDEGNGAARRAMAAVACLSRPACYGPIIAPSKAARARPSHQPGTKKSSKRRKKGAHGR